MGEKPPSVKPTKTKKTSAGPKEVKEIEPIRLAHTDQRILNLMDHLLEIKVIRFKNDFAKAIGITKAQLNLVRIGKQKFTVKAIETICEVYKVNPSWIFGYENNIFRKFPELKSDAK